MDLYGQAQIREDLPSASLLRRAETQTQEQVRQQNHEPEPIVEVQLVDPAFERVVLNGEHERGFLQGEPERENVVRVHNCYICEREGALSLPCRCRDINYCVDCIRQWASSQAEENSDLPEDGCTCPTCREEFTNEQLVAAGFVL
jgi:hypothetical protein